MIPDHIKVYTLQHQNPQTVLPNPCSKPVTGGLVALPDMDMPFHESDNVSRSLDLEFNNRSNFDFDPHSVPDGSGYKDPTPAGHILNDLIGDGPVVAPEQSAQVSLSEDVASSTEAPLQSHETAAVVQQNKPRNEGYIMRLSRSCSPHLSNVNWEDYLDFPPDICSPAGALAATLDLFRHSPVQSSIVHGWKPPSPEPFISNNSVRATSEHGITFEGMSLGAVTKPLMLVEDTFFRSLSEVSDDRSSGFREDNFEWVFDEFSNLLAASHEASASAIRKRPLRSKTNEASWTPLSSNCSTRAISTPEAASSSGSDTQELLSVQKLSKMFRIISTGLLSIKLTTGASHGSSKITTAAFTFIPAYEICKEGVSVTLGRTSVTVRNPSIARSIISFNVVPGEAPIFDAIIYNDIGKVQELFSSKQASPHDRNSEGTTLLGVSPNLLEKYLSLLTSCCISSQVPL